MNNWALSRENNLKQIYAILLFRFSVHPKKIANSSIRCHYNKLVKSSCTTEVKWSLCFKKIKTRLSCENALKHIWLFNHKQSWDWYIFNKLHVTSSTLETRTFLRLSTAVWSFILVYGLRKCPVPNKYSSLSDIIQSSLLFQYFFDLNQMDLKNLTSCEDLKVSFSAEINSVK